MRLGNLCTPRQHFQSHFRHLTPPLSAQNIRAHCYNLAALEDITVNLPALAESITEGEIGVLEVGTCGGDVDKIRSRPVCRKTVHSLCLDIAVGSQLKNDPVTSPLAKVRLPPLLAGYTTPCSFFT
jgi:hypothetical protein